MLIEILIISLTLSFLLNLFLIYKNSTNNKPLVTFEEAFTTLNSIIEVQRANYDLGLSSLSKKYTILNGDGTTSSPNNSIEEYVRKKKELKSSIVKNIFHCLSKPTRNKILQYYTNKGIIDYVIVELDKEDTEI